VIFQPRPYQQQAIQRLLDHPAHMLALPLGAGKSVIVLTAVREMLFDSFDVSRVLVIAPKRVAELVWHTECGKWTHTEHLRVERVIGTREQRMAALAKPADIHIVNRENFPWLVELVEQSGEPWPWDCVVLDELVGFRDRGSKAWKSLKRVRGQIKRLYQLCGTPAPNGLLDLWAPVAMLDQGQRLGRSLTAFKDRWFVPDRRNGMVVYTWKPRAGAEQEIHEAISDIVMSVDAQVHLPPRIDNIVPVSIDMARYRELERNAVSGAVTAPSAAVLAQKFLQLANGAVYNDDGQVEHVHDAKLDALQEIVDDGRQVLCLVSFVHDQTRILARFPQARVFDGEQSLRAWKAGKVPLLVMHPASGGHGVDGLQDGGSTVVWFGLPWSLELYLQANGRLHRSGQKQSVIVHHLVAQGTIDERVMAVLAAKGNVQQALLDAVKGLQQGVTA